MIRKNSYYFTKFPVDIVMILTVFPLAFSAGYIFHWIQVGWVWSELAMDWETKK